MASIPKRRRQQQKYNKLKDKVKKNRGALPIKQSSTSRLMPYSKMIFYKTKNSSTKSFLTNSIKPFLCLTKNNSLAKNSQK
jgi:hypothetical protein